jgi:imidazolonepropionase-like amidohydrolase
MRAKHSSWLFFCVIVGVLALTGVLLAKESPFAAPSCIAITHVSVIDGTGAPESSDMCVLVQGDRISRVDKNSKVSIPPGALVVNASGKFLIPGLWDMHVHLAGIEADPRWSKGLLLPLLVGNGITGVRDMGGSLEALVGWRNEIATGQLIGPRIVAAGPMLDAHGGDKSPEIITVRSDREVAQIVSDLKSGGADFIKVLSSLDRESYFAIARESKRNGLTFAGHVPDSVRVDEASDAGQKSIEHIYYSDIPLACSSDEAALRKERSEAREKKQNQRLAEIADRADATFSEEKAAALWTRFIANGTWAVPTLIGLYTNAHMVEAARDSARLKYIPKTLAERWQPDKILRGTSERTFAWYKRQSEYEMKVVTAMHKAGVRILAGSDSLDTCNIPGFSLHDELAMLVKAGLTPMEAIQSATIGAARFLGMQDRLGTIEKGKLADLVLLDGNPLADIENTRKIGGIVVGGKLMDRPRIEAMLRGIEEQARKD